MKQRWHSVRREDGQALIIMALALVVMLGFAGLVVDIGRAYLAQRQLQTAVDAAALAGGQSMPNSTLAQTQVIDYSATGSAGNAHPQSMAAAGPTVTFKCLAFNATAVPCTKDPADATTTSPCKASILASGVPAGSYIGCNAVQVAQQATVSTLFARIFNVSQFTVTAKATASMRGGIRQPLDIVFVLDSTASMEDNCGDAVRDVGTVSTPGPIVISASNSRKIDCAKDGVRQFLKSLQPCKLSVNGNCPNAGPNVVDQVALMTFPGLVDGNATNHDNTGTRSNFLLETTNSCSGALNSTPPWYVGGGGFPKWFLNSNDLSYGSNASPAVSVVTITQTTGTFTLSYNGQTTAPLAWNINSALTVQNALQGLSTIGNGNVGVSKNGAGTVYTVTFQGALGNVQPFPITAAAQAGAGPPPNPGTATLTQGAPGTNEVQTVTVNQTSGSFTLTWNGDTTNNIQWNASAATVTTELVGLNGIGNGDVAVVRTGAGTVASPYVHTVTFQGALAATNVAAITAATNNTTPAPNPTVVTNTGGSNVGTNEVQTVTVNQTSGTFRLGFNGQTTATIAWNASAATIQTALVNLSNIGNGDVLVSRPSNTGPFTVTFTGALGNQNVSQLSEQAGNLNIGTTTPGSAGTNEVQTVTLNQTNGTFTLNFNGQTTGNIQWNANQGTIQTALTNLSNIGNNDVAVTRSGTGPFTVTFQNGLGNQNVVQLTGTASGTTPATPPSIGISTNGSGGTNEVQTVNVTQTTGNFTITYNGQTTAQIAFNASSGTVDTALENLSNIGNGDVTVTRSGSGPYTFTITFQNGLGGQNVNQVTAVAIAGVLTQPTVTNNPYQPATAAAYGITTLSNDFRVSNAATALNPLSRMVGATYWSSCPGPPTNRFYGLTAVGGINTYYAGAVSEAQNALAADAARNAQPVIILLSDGDAQANASDLPPGKGTNQCHQAINAAVAAASSSIHTLVYSIAYGASTSSTGSCSTDSPRISAFSTMQQIARNGTDPTIPDPTHFFCLPAGSGCTSANTLSDIFKKIAEDLTSARLISDDVT